METIVFLEVEEFLYRETEVRCESEILGWVSSTGGKEEEGLCVKI